MNGCLFLEKSGDLVAVKVDANLNSYNSVMVTGQASREKQVNQFAEGVKGIITNNIHT